MTLIFNIRLKRSRIIVMSYSDILVPGEYTLNGSPCGTSTNKNKNYIYNPFQ